MDSSPEARELKITADHNAEETTAKEKLMKEIVKSRVQVYLLRKKKRVLLEEIHRQCLEGEVDPKKKLKIGDDNPPAPDDILM